MILFLSSNFVIFTKSEPEDFSENLKINSSETIDDFSNFHLVNDNANIESNISDDYIYFNVPYNPVITKKQFESYEMSFVNATDFRISVTLDYQYTSSYLGDLNLLVYSDYEESGIPNKNFMAECTLKDWWTGDGGYYSIRATPNQIIDEHTTSHGSLLSSDILEFAISRENGILSCTISNESSIIIGNNWTSGLQRPANSVLIHIGSSVDYVDVVECTFSNFLGTFEFEDNSLPFFLIPISKFLGFQYIWICLGFIFGIGSIAVITLLDLRKRTWYLTK